MQFQIDTKFMTDCFQHIVSIPSPVGYFEELNPVLESYAAQFGQKMTYDNRHTAYITLEGQDNNNKTVLIGAHGMERTHIKGLENTVNLMLAYTLDI